MEPPEMSCNRNKMGDTIFHNELNIRELLQQGAFL
jgi:hypothetical protein